MIYKTIEFRWLSFRNCDDLLYQDRIYRITCTDRRDHDHENVTPVDMHPKTVEYFANIKTKYTQSIEQNLSFDFSVLLDFFVVETKHPYTL